MKLLVLVSAIANICVIVGVTLVYTSFFTGNWLTVYKIPGQVDAEADDDVSDTQSVAVQQVVKNHGLWDHGLSDLNCDVTPFGICMYTRAGMFAGMVLAVPALLFTILSTAVVASGGKIETSGTLARAGGIVLTLSDIGVLIAAMLFTIQHTGCITSCPPNNTYYPVYPNDLSFGWSFFLAWIGLFFLIATTVLLFVFAKLVEEKYKVSFSPNMMNTLRPTPAQPVDVNIELVRVNQAVVEKENQERQEGGNDSRRV